MAVTEAAGRGHPRPVAGHGAYRQPDDRIGLADLYRAHAGFVWRCLRRFGIPEEALEDIVHEVFMVVRRRLPEWDGRCPPTTWLYPIARGVAANTRRSRARAEARRPFVPMGEPPVDPERAAERNEALACVAAFLDELDPDQREVFELIDLEGMRGPEVAALLTTNLNVVYSRLRIARRKLVSFLDARGHSPMRRSP